MAQKVKMHAKNIDDQYVQVYPETVASQVVVEATGQTLEQMVKSGNFGGGGVAKTEHPVITASVNGQTEFPFNDPDFLVDDHHVTVHLNGEFLHKDEEYTVVKAAGQMPKVVLKQGVSIGDKIHVTVEKGGPGGGGITDASQLADGSIPASKLEKTVDNLTTVLSQTIVTENTYYYIDPVNGSDDNSGLDKEAPVRTFTKLSTMLSNTITLEDFVLTAKLAPGVYEGILKVKNFGNIVLEGPSLTGDDDYAIISNAYIMDDLHTVCMEVGEGDLFVITGKIKMIPTVDTSRIYHKTIVGQRVKVFKAAGLEIDFSNVDITVNNMGVSTPFRMDDSPVQIDNTSFKNVAVPAYGDSSNIKLLNCRLDNCGGGSANFNGFYSEISCARTNSPEGYTGGMHPYSSGINLEQVKHGIIVESGLNENGRYELYNNGLALLYTRIEVPFVDASVSKQEIRWTLPYSSGTSSVSVTYHTSLSNLAPAIFYGDENAAQLGLKFIVQTRDGSPIRTANTPHLGLDIMATARWK